MGSLGDIFLTKYNHYANVWEVLPAKAEARKATKKTVSSNMPEWEKAKKDEWEETGKELRNQVPERSKGKEVLDSAQEEKGREWGWREEQKWWFQRWGYL